MTTLEEMQNAVQEGATKILTLERAKGLKGKRIATIIFDFQPPHRHKVDEFIIGDIKSEFDLQPDQRGVLKEYKEWPHIIRRMKLTYEIITHDNRRTSLRTQSYRNEIFTGPDIDNEVWFKEV
jgi:hypothetical protein